MAAHVGKLLEQRFSMGDIEEMQADDAAFGAACDMLSTATSLPQIDARHKIKEATLD
jgi:hypothetical protein